MGGVWRLGRVAAAAFVFERTAAGARGVASDVWRLGGRLRGLGDLVELEVAVDVVELDLGEGGLADRRALRFDQFDDLHGGFESDGCRGLLVAQNVSKSVECEVGETAELVQEEFGSVVAGSEQGAGDGGVFLGPEVDGGPVNAADFGGGGDGLAYDESLKDILLNGRERVEDGRFGGHGVPAIRLHPEGLIGSRRLRLK